MRLTFELIYHGCRCSRGSSGVGTLEVANPFWLTGLDAPIMEITYKMSKISEKNSWVYIYIFYAMHIKFHGKIYFLRHV
jgi:hypothetical protein